VGEDRGEVAVGEPARRGGLTERPVDGLRPVRGGHLDRLRHLGPDPAGAGRGGLGQPYPGAAAEGEELRLGCGAGLRLAVQRPGRGGRVVRPVQPPTLGWRST
jgi:hypothetical protein